MSWNKGRVHIRFNENISELLKNQRLKQHLEKEYTGPTEFFEKALEREEAEITTLEEEIEELQQDLVDKERQLEEKKQQLEERQRKERIREKKQELVEKKNQLSRVKSEDSVPEEKAFEQFKERLGHKFDSEAEMRESDSWQSVKENRCSNHNQVRKIKEEISRIQDRIRRMNDGDDLDCFIDVEKTEEVRSP